AVLLDVAGGDLGTGLGEPASEVRAHPLGGTGDDDLQRRKLHGRNLPLPSAAVAVCAQISPPATDRKTARTMMRATAAWSSVTPWELGWSSSRYCCGARSRTRSCSWCRT